MQSGWLVFQNDVEGVNNTRNPSEYSQKDVDAQILIAAAFHEHTEWGKDDSTDELEDVAESKSHCRLIDVVCSDVQPKKLSWSPLYTFS